MFNAFRNFMNKYYSVFLTFQWIQQFIPGPVQVVKTDIWPILYRPRPPTPPPPSDVTGTGVIPTNRSGADVAIDSPDVLISPLKAGSEILENLIPGFRDLVLHTIWGTRSTNPSRYSS